MESGDAGAQNQYTQIYGPLGKGDNYTSPLLHTIKVTGLSPKTRYYYQCAPAARSRLHEYVFADCCGARTETLACAAVPVPYLPLQRCLPRAVRDKRGPPTSKRLLAAVTPPCADAGSATASHSPRPTTSRRCPPWAPTSASRSW